MDLELKPSQSTYKTNIALDTTYTIHTLHMHIIDHTIHIRNTRCTHKYTIHTLHTQSIPGIREVHTKLVTPKR